MEFKELIMKRYATKQFDGKKVPDDKINELCEMVRFAPSGLNLQPWKIKIVADQKVKEELVPASFGQAQIASCSHLFVFCTDTDTDGVIGRLSQMLKKGGAPAEMHDMVMGMAKGMTGSMPAEARLGWMKCQTYLALEYALLGAKSLGLDSCPMTGFNPVEYSRILKLPDDLVPTILAAVGYPADVQGPKMRLAKEEIFF